MFWIALAAQMTLPVALGTPYGDVRQVFSPDDMPAYVELAGESRIIRTRTTVRTDGLIQSCIVEERSGDDKLDAYTCSLILKRAKFRPATWTDGSPVYGVIRVPVIWAIGDIRPSDADAFSAIVFNAIVPDMELSVNRLPKGAHSPVGVGLLVAAEADGRVVTCIGYLPPGSKKPKGYFPELIPIACQQVMSKLKVPPPLDADGKPMRSVQTVAVNFKKDR